MLSEDLLCNLGLKKTWMRVLCDLVRGCKGTKPLKRVCWSKTRWKLMPGFDICGNEEIFTNNSRLIKGWFQKICKLSCCLELGTHSTTRRLESQINGHKQTLTAPVMRLASYFGDRIVLIPWLLQGAGPALMVSKSRPSFLLAISPLCFSLHWSSASWHHQFHPRLPFILQSSSWTPITSGLQHWYVILS